MNHAADPLAVLRATRALAVAATLALIALGLAWELWLAPTGSGTLAIKVLPLLLPLPGLMRMRLYTYRWTSLLVWLYVAEGAVRATSERAAGLAARRAPRSCSRSCSSSPARCTSAPACASMPAPRATARAAAP